MSFLQKYRVYTVYLGIMNWHELTICWVVRSDCQTFKYRLFDVVIKFISIVISCLVKDALLVNIVKRFVPGMLLKYGLPVYPALFHDYTDLFRVVTTVVDCL